MTTPMVEKLRHAIARSCAIVLLTTASSYALEIDVNDDARWLDWPRAEQCIRQATEEWLVIASG